jgi:putative peptide zinc metalloprotease protein
VKRALAIVLTLACASPAGAQAAPARDNVASAVTETDGAYVSDFAWDVTRQSGGDVDQLNSATAQARCTDCGATAIAFQVVLVSGPSGSLVPHNRAVAVNDQCTRCVVAAEARQFVRVVDEPVKFTDEGMQQLADIRQDLRDLARANLSVADLHAAVERDEARVLDVMANEVVPKADPEGTVRGRAARVLEASG